MAPTTPPGRFGTMVTAMVTPFDASGRLDCDAAANLARWLTEHGSDGLVVAGTTGEGPVLSDDEKRDLWRAVSEAVTVPVVAGAGTNDTAHSMELAKAAQEAGADGVLVVTPYYSRPSQQGLFAHFRAVAESTRLPVMLYDIPVRTGRRIARQTIVQLATEVRNIVAVKDATGDVVGAARLVAEAPAGFEHYSGDDSFTLPLLAVGSLGLVSVAGHWVGRELAAMIGSFMAGDVASARATNAALADSVSFQSSDEWPNPLPAKAACRALGLAVGQCRLPLGPAPDELDERARAVVAACQPVAVGATGVG